MRPPHQCPKWRMMLSFASDFTRGRSRTRAMSNPETDAAERPQGVVVTGAAGDLGSAVADSFIRDGFRVFGADVAPIPPRPGLVATTLDVTDRAGLFALAERAAEETALWAWINAAGIVAVQPVEEADPALWARI